MSEAILSQILGQLKSIKEDVHDIKADVHVLKEDVSFLKTEVNVLQEDVNVLKKDNITLKQEMRIANQRLDRVEQKVDAITTQQEEDHLILRALEHRTEVGKAERENHDLKIVKLEGRTTALENKQVAVANILKEA